MSHNVFYFSNINSIGGIEQFFAYLAEKYSDWDITIYYDVADPTQLARLRKYVRTVKFTGQPVVCDKLFCCFNTKIKQYVEAKETALILHGDYLAMVEQNQLDRDCYIFNEVFDKYYGVSKVVCDSWKKLTGIDCELIYNPYIHKEPKKILDLVYCGRLSQEKGGDLATQLIKRLTERNIDYRFFVYSNKTPFEDEHVIYLKTRLDACQVLNPDNYDYLIVPSKNEGYCYSLVQALANGLPVIATPCPVFKELGVNETNSITLEFDGSNIDEVIDKMATKKKFKYQPPEDTWDKVLEPGKSDYQESRVKIRALIKYLDVELNERVLPGQEYTVDKERANTIISAGFAELVKEN